MGLKTANQNNFRLVRSCFLAFCEAKGLEPFTNSVVWEHEGFSCSARDDEDFDDDIKHFRAVDACCLMCGTADYCFACGRNCQIDFEEV